MRGVEKYARLSILPLGLALISLGARSLARSAFDSLINFRAPQFTMKPGSGADPVSRVVLVVIDGLRVDTFNTMRYMTSLKEGGAYFTLKTGQPSLSLPGSAVIATGAWQEITGVTTNWFEGSVRHDNLFTLAKEGGLTTVLAGGTGMGQLFGKYATETFAPEREHDYISFDEQTLTEALKFLSADPGFSLVHFIDTDEAGHDFGGASSEYQKYAGHIDGLIQSFTKACAMTRFSSSPRTTARSTGAEGIYETGH